MPALPEDFDETKRYAALVMAHPGGGVKVQTAQLYAKRMAAAGNTLTGIEYQLDNRKICRIAIGSIADGVPIRFIKEIAE